MKLSARNLLKATVKEVTTGMVSSEIILELPGGQEVVSIISKHSAEALELAPGREVHAVVKASNVMIAVE
ncbi:MAG: molybdopterin-binding protein [Dehalococcoidia bacterium]